jgi:regulator of protease activity HflC (stomatin/prohibitin superfamily)
VAGYSRPFFIQFKENNMNIANFFQGFVVLMWVMVIVLAAIIMMRVSRSERVGGLGSMLGIIVVLAIVLTTVSAGLVFINPQERGVVISALSGKGYRDQALQPGLRWVIPFAENVVTYPISRETYTMSAATSEGQKTGDDSIAARTSDGQQVQIDASVIYYIDQDKVVTVHINWQKRYTEELVRPLVRGVIRDAVSQFGVAEVYGSKRAELQTMITDELTKRLSDNGLVLQEFILRDISFSPEYAASVEQKQIAEQQAQQAKFVVESKRQEAEQARQVAQGQADASVIAAKGQAEARLIQADAEAKALDMISKVLKDNTEMLNYQYITKLSPNVSVMMMPSNSSFMLPFPGQAYGPAAPQTSPTVTVQPAQPLPTPTLPVPTPTAKP